VKNEGFTCRVQLSSERTLKWTIDDPPIERELQNLPRYSLAGKQADICAMSKLRISETVVPAFASRGRQFFH
jgi:hypothetical protein